MWCWDDWKVIDLHIFLNLESMRNLLIVLLAFCFSQSFAWAQKKEMLVVG
jgi:hypothetical protein